MKFSVLIPVYNTEKYLEECLQSVLNQTYQDFEIVIVDDGSIDNSGKICDEYQEKYPGKIKVIHKENQGLISARRVGIANATGDYCIFVDSDDYIKPELLNWLNVRLLQNKDVDILIYSYCYIQNGVVGKSYHRIEEDGRTWTSDNRSEIYKKLLFSNDVTPLWIKAVKTTLLKSDPTDYSVYYGKNMAEDFLQSLYLITYANKIVYYYLPLYCYNYNDTSISRNYSHNSIAKQNKLHVYDKLLDYLSIWKMNSTETINRINAGWFSDTMYLFFKCYENAKAKHSKKSVLEFEWDSMLPCTDITSFEDYTDKDYLTVYKYWKNGKNGNLNRYFCKRKLYQKYRKIRTKGMT